MSDIVNRLRTNRECLAPCLMDEAADQIELLRAERDEARREVCDRIAYPNRFMHLDRPRTMYEVAHERGWDCFKEAADDRPR